MADWMPPEVAQADWTPPEVSKGPTPEAQRSMVQWRSGGMPDLPNLQEGPPGSFAGKAGMPERNTPAWGSPGSDPTNEYAPGATSKPGSLAQRARDLQRRYVKDPAGVLKQDIAPEVASAADLISPWGVVGMAVGATTSALGYGFGLDQGMDRKTAAKTALGFGSEMAQGPLIPGTNVHLLTPATDIVKLFSGKDEPSNVEEAMGALTQGLAFGGDFVEKASGGAIKSEEVQGVAQALMARFGMKGYGWDGKGPAPKEVTERFEKGATQILDEYAKKADQGPPPELDKVRFSTLAKAGMVDASGAPLMADAKATPKEIVAENGVPLTKQSGKVDKEVLAALGIGGAAAAVIVPIVQNYLDGKTKREDAEKALQKALEEGKTAPKDDGSGYQKKLPGTLIPPQQINPKDILDKVPKSLAGLGIAALMMMDPRTSLKDIHPELDYSTKVLADLNDTMGGRSTFTREQVLQRANQPTIGKFEREMFTDIMKDRKDITAAGLVAEVKKRTGNFELKAQETDSYANYGLENIERLEMDERLDAMPGEDEHVVAEGTGPKARTTVYQSPVELGTANHFSDPNYFAHARSFDEGGVRHVVEIQSDLAQKAGKELTAEERAGLEQRYAEVSGLNDQLQAKRVELNAAGRRGSEEFQVATSRVQGYLLELRELESKLKNRSAIDSVRPMLKNWDRRIVREEIAQAQRVGNASVRFATADTVAKVEGWPKVDPIPEAEMRYSHAQNQFVEAESRNRMFDYAKADTTKMKAAADAAFEALEKLRAEKSEPRLRPEHQGIYDRYRRDIETYLNKQLKGKPYTDEHGHTWIEVPLPETKSGKIAPTQMMGGADPKLLATLAGIGLAAYAGSKANPEAPLEAAIAAGSAVLIAKRLPEFLHYLKTDFHNALKDTAGVALAGGLVGAAWADKKEHFDTTAAAIVSLALIGAKSLPKASIPKIGNLSIDDLANIRAGELARRERTYTNLRKAFEEAIPDQARREAVWAEAQSPSPSGLSPTEMKVVKAWQGFTQEMAKDLADQDLLKDFVENYVTRTAKKSGASSQSIKDALSAMFEVHPDGSFAVSSKFLKSRTGISIAELEKALAERGLRLDKDIASVVETYGRSVGKAIENRKFVNALKGSGPIDSPYIVPAGKAPLNYVPVRAPSLQGKMVHPDLAPYLKMIMEGKSNNEMVNGALALSMAQKRLAVGFSFFHAYNLAIAHAGARGLPGAVSDFAREALHKLSPNVRAPISAAIEMYRRGGLGDQVDWGIRSGLKVDPISDVNLDAISHLGRLADATIERTTGLKTEAGERTLGRLEKVQRDYFDRFTWDYMHFGLKNSLFIREFERALAKEGFPDWSKAPDALKMNVAKQVSSFVNDTYGHLDWNRVAQEATSQLGRKFANMALSPNGRMIAQLLMFAPDWTLSTFRAMYKALPGKTDTPINKRLHTLYALRTSFYIMAIADAINVQTSGHHIWDPEQKDPLRIEFKDGTSMQLFKHATEFGEWVREPLKTLRNKMGFLPAEVISQIANQEYPGSKMPLQGSRLSHALSGAAPFPAKPFFDPALSGGEAAEKSVLGSVGIQSYGHTDDQKARLREAKRKKKDEEDFQRLLK